MKSSVGCGEVSPRVINRADHRVTHSDSVVRSLKRRCPVLEKPVFEDDDLARVQLMPEDRIRGRLALVRDVLRPVEIGLSAAANPVNNVENTKLLLIIVRRSNDVREGPEQVHAKRAVGLPPTGRYEVEKGMNEFLGLRVAQEHDSHVITLARDASPVRNGDRIVLLHMEPVVMPLVPDDVSCPLAIHRPVALVAVKRLVIEISLSEVLAELLWEPDCRFIGQRVALAVQVGPDTIKSSTRGAGGSIAHGCSCSRGGRFGQAGLDAALDDQQHATPVIDCTLIKTPSPCVLGAPYTCADAQSGRRAPIATAPGPNCRGQTG